MAEERIKCGKLSVAMKRDFRFYFVQVFVVIMLMAISAIPALAVDKDLALAERLEKEGRCAEAATYWEKMQSKAKSLSARVKYTLPVVRCKIRYSRFLDVESELERFDLHSEDQGKSFVKALYPDLFRGVKNLAHQYPDLSIQRQAFKLLSYYLKHFPKEGPKIAQELYAEGLRDLALMVDYNVIVKQCSGLMAKMQKVTGTEADLNNYSYYISTCSGQPVSPSVCQQAFKSGETATDPYTKLRFYSAGKMMGCQVAEKLQPEIISIVNKFANTPDEQGSSYNKDAADLGRKILPVDVMLVKQKSLKEEQDEAREYLKKTYGVE